MANVADFWGSVIRAGEITTTNTPLSASTNIADFWAKVAEAGEVPISSTPFAACANIADFWMLVAQNGVIPTTSDAPTVETMGDFWDWVAANGAIPSTFSGAITASNMADRWRAVMGGGAADTTAPTVAITSTESNGTFANPIPLTFTFSETVTGFEIGDITVGAGGSIGNFAGSGTTYTADLTITTALATVTVDVAAEVCQDAAGNNNTAATQFSITSGLFLRDDFSDNPALAAGAVNGTAANPGPGGNRAVADTESKVTTDLTQLVIAGGKGTPANGDPGIWWSSVARAAGKCLMSKQYLANVTGICYTSWDTNTAGLGTYLVGANAATITDESLRIDINASMTALNDLYQAEVLRGTGIFKLVKGGGIYPNWTLLWVRSDGADANLYPSICNNNKVTNFDYVHGGLLGAPWTTDDGIATAILAGARAAGDTWTAEANFLLYFTVTTLPSSGSIEVRFRIQDASNYWRVVINSDGTYTLDEVATGSPTNRRSGTGITNGARICVRTTTTNICVWRGTTAITSSWYPTTAYNTQTAGKLQDLGTGGAVTRIEVWPMTISGAAATALASLNHDNYAGFQVNSASMPNAAARLTIPNGETGGNANQVVHPGLCRPNPAGKWKGYTYWMCIMPYPESDTTKELPAVVVSDDMETWQVPTGGSLIVSPAAGGGVVSSDNDLLYDAATDTLYIIYRNTDDATYDSICIRSTTDGITWSEPTEIMHLAYRACLSPAPIKKADGSFEIYAIDQTTLNAGKCVVFTCATLTGSWSAATTVMNRTVYGYDPDMWHLDVYLDTNTGYYLAMLTIHTTGDYMWLASSTDGRRWHIADAPVMFHSVSGWDNLWIYRGSLGIRTATGFDVIYSGKSNDGTGDWGAGRTQLTIPVV